MRKEIQAQAKGSPELLRFLHWYCEQEFRRNIYTEGYGEERAFHDGRAKAVEDLDKLIEEITND